MQASDKRTDLRSSESASIRKGESREREPETLGSIRPHEPGHSEARGSGRLCGGGDGVEGDRSRAHTAVSLPNASDLEHSRRTPLTLRTLYEPVD